MRGHSASNRGTPFKTSASREIAFGRFSVATSCRDNSRVMLGVIRISCTLERLKAIDMRVEESIAEWTH